MTPPLRLPAAETHPETAAPPFRDFSTHPSEPGMLQVNILSYLGWAGVLLILLGTDQRAKGRIWQFFAPKRERVLCISNLLCMWICKWWLSSYFRSFLKTLNFLLYIPNNITTWNHIFSFLFSFLKNDHWSVSMDLRIRKNAWTWILKTRQNKAGKAPYVCNTCHYLAAPACWFASYTGRSVWISNTF